MAGGDAVSLRRRGGNPTDFGVAQNESPKYTQKQLRHASIDITFNTYGHLFPDVHRRLPSGWVKPCSEPKQPLRSAARSGGLSPYSGGRRGGRFIWQFQLAQPFDAYGIRDVQEENRGPGIFKTDDGLAFKMIDVFNIVAVNRDLFPIYQGYLSLLSHGEAS